MKGKSEPAAGVFHRQFFLPGPAGRLEALLWTVEAPERAPAAAVVCHPHPLFGGTMHNKVVFQVAKTLHRLELPVLRFNFRGVGLSQGKHDRGEGERADVTAAVNWLERESSGKPILLAGFSFGSWVGLRAGCEDERVAELIGLGLPVNSTDFSFLRSCAKPKLILQGGRDQFGKPQRVEDLVREVPGATELMVFEGADHFFAGQLSQVGGEIERWLKERHPELGVGIARD